MYILNCIVNKNHFWLIIRIFY